ncbi:M24 family metallopeptidase [Marinibaculum pumilum]|uniref:M24 family metallopeptidase n=1 Tax=Marinibaculum pumilum TaxID=1766165 RepID=A0ABV7L375_9PROT
MIQAGMTGSAPDRGLPAGECAARCTRAQALMAAAGLDLILLTTEPEVRYFSGFLTPFWQSPTRPWFLLLPADGRPVAVVPRIGAVAMAATWVTDIRTWPSPRPQDEGISLLADTVRDLAGTTPMLGVSQGPESHLRLPLTDWNRLLAGLPGAVLRDATPILRQLRMVKSPAEIAKIAHVCDLVSEVFEGMPAWLRPGMSDIEVFRRFRIACLEAGADDVPYLVGGAGPGGYGDIISPPQGRPLAPGDVLVLDTGATFDGYFCDFDRNYALGPADDAARDGYRLLHAATEAGFAAARPGNTCADLFAAMQAVLGRADGDVGRMGHGLGMQLTEWPSHTADDETVLQPGMVITLEPSLDLAPGRMMVHEENLVIEAAGTRWLTRRAPAELPVID